MKMVLTLAALVVALPGCHGGGSASADSVPTEPPAIEATASGSGSGSGEVAQAGAPAADRYPNLMFQLLEDAERARYVRLAEAELCPCGAVESLDTCLRREDVCELGLESGALMMRLVKQGAEDVEISDQVQQYVTNARRVWEFELSDTPWVGAENPEVVLVNFSDFECPHCREFAHVLDAIAERYGDRVRIYYKQYPLPSHRNAQAAAFAALAAHRQGQFMAFHDLVFQNQQALSAATDPIAFLVAMASQAGLNAERFVADANDAALRAQVDRDRTEGVTAGIMSTPTLFVNGVRMLEGYTVDELGSRLEAALTN